MSRRHISTALKAKIRAAAKNQCGYCQSQQKYVLGILEIEHMISTAAGGSDDEENLWLSCRLCNSYKGIQISALPMTEQTIPLFNPRTQRWSEHFVWSEDGVYVMGLTPCGRATVVAIQLNNDYAVTVRQSWVSVGWHPPREEE